jgi:hypothetical protein
MTRFFEIFRNIFELRLVNYTFSQKQTFVNEMTNFVFKNCCTSTFELCCFVMYRVRKIVNRRESDVICSSCPVCLFSVIRVQGFSFWPFLWKFQHNLEFEKTTNVFEVKWILEAIRLLEYIYIYSFIHFTHSNWDSTLHKVLVIRKDFLTSFFCLYSKDSWELPAF